MQVTGFGDKVAFIWSVADILRGDFKAHEFGQVILPFTVLRRLECALKPTKADVVARAEGLVGKVINVDKILQSTAGHNFYNISPLTLTKILGDDKNVAQNLKTYIAGFSTGAAEVLERYGFSDKIDRLDKAGLIYQVTAKFAELDLSEQAVPNDAMGYIFEELLRRFSEMSNETAGEHFTPREVIRLMVNILFAEDDKALTGQKPVRTLYDPACGTGGMLTEAQTHLKALNPNAVLEVYGQELNSETWAIARSDLMIKGQDPSRIILGNSLTHEDGHFGEHFDYLLANPPFGVDWKKYAAPIQAERDSLGFEGRYGAGLPRVSDGSFLFLMHMLSKMKPVKADGSGGTRLAIVFSGSPLFAGAAGGGESEIRRWILENDWLEGIVALPDQMFYNTGISTYLWILSNRKGIERRGQVVLLDARESFEKMRKSLGNKRKFTTEPQIGELTRLYADALASPGADKRVKVFDREAFGYQRVTVERPLRRRWELSAEAVGGLAHEKAWLAWLVPPKATDDALAFVEEVEQSQDRLLGVLRAMVGISEATEAAFTKRLKAAATDNNLDVPAKVLKLIIGTAAVPDAEAPVLTDRKGNPLPDPDLRDAENVPLTSGFLDLSENKRDSVLASEAADYLKAEIHPYADDAWLDLTKTKLGFEIPFTRHFYEYVPPRPVAEIDAELAETERQIQELLGGLAR
jgi:type I restriction enzyme M protein